eukprot:gene30427-37640_t
MTVQFDVSQTPQSFHDETAIDDDTASVNDDDKHSSQPTIQRCDVILRVIDPFDSAVDCTYNIPCLSVNISSKESSPCSSLSDVREGFALRFPGFSRFDLIRRGDNDSPLTSETELQEYLESAHNSSAGAVLIYRSDKPSRQLAPQDFSALSASTHGPQQRVAEELLKRVCLSISGDTSDSTQCLTKFTKIHYLILVPKFNSLKQQTKERIEACSNLVREGQDTMELVELYPKTSEAESICDRFCAKAVDAANQKTLYVLIVDECHYAPKLTSIKSLHGDVNHSPNFISLLVSATPFNCLSERSRIQLKNIVDWSEVMENSDERPHYVGIEHYFRSVAFRIGTSNSFELSVGGGVPVQIELSSTQEFCDFKALALAITEKCSPAGVACGFGLDKDKKEERQHMRCDKAFEAIYEEMSKKCPVLKRVGNSNSGKPLQLSDILFSSASPPRKPPREGFTMMEAANGFTILIDYILSMAYFGSCRVDIAGGKLELSPFPEPLDITAVTNEMCESFLSMLDKCCRFDDLQTKTTCDLCAAMKAVVNLMYSAARDENVGAEAVLTDFECLRHILFDKMKGDRKSQTTSESQSWFTETDRIVEMLISQRKVHGPMVLMRVYDNDENKTMQTILRHAMEQCKLCVPPSTGGQHQVRAFSVISDISNTKLLHEIEPYFRDEHNVSDSGDAGMFLKDIPTRRRLQHAESKKSDTSPNLDLKYEDLLNVPCLIILCEKGRMGDTFPHTLRTLDLRLRPGGTASCFLQEIGRMCRYPMVMSTSDPMNASECSVVDGGAIANIIKPDSFGYLMRDAANNSYLGVAHTLADVKEILDRNYADWANIRITLSELKHALPYALVDPKIMKSVHRAINDREAEMVKNEELLTANKLSCEKYRLNRAGRLLANLKMDKGVDYYISGKSIHAEHHAYTVVKTKEHYDLANTKDVDGNYMRFKNRFLLSAECQVGKTGAYLHFLSMLRMIIERQLDAAAPTPPQLSEGEEWWKWLIPRNEDLSNQLNLKYDFPKKGKYHESIAKERLGHMRAILSSRVQVNFRQQFIALISTAEVVATERGVGQLNNLPELTGIVPNSEFVYLYLNWDGRFDGTHGGYSHARALSEQFVRLLNTIKIGETVVVPRAADQMFGVVADMSSSDDEVDTHFRDESADMTAK